MFVWLSDVVESQSDVLDELEDSIDQVCWVAMWEGRRAPICLVERSQHMIKHDMLPVPLSKDEDVLLRRFVPDSLSKDEALEQMLSPHKYSDKRVRHRRDGCTRSVGGDPNAHRGEEGGPGVRSGHVCHGWNSRGDIVSALPHVRAHASGEVTAAAGPKKFVARRRRRVFWLRPVGFSPGGGFFVRRRFCGFFVRRRVFWLFRRQNH